MPVSFLPLPRPSASRAQEEARKQSGMLSHVPHEMDVRAHVKAVFNRSAHAKSQATAAERDKARKRELDSAQAEALAAAPAAPGDGGGNAIARAKTGKMINAA